MLRKMKIKEIFLLVLTSLAFASASASEASNTNSFASEYLAHPYFFAEAGYGMVAGLRTVEANSSFPLPVAGTSVDVSDSSKMTDATPFSIGAGFNLPLLVNVHWLAGNSLELSLNHFQNESDGVRTENQIIHGAAYPRTTTAYNYHVSDFLVLINYVVDFKPIFKHVQPFAAIGAGFNRSSVTDYTQTITSGTVPYINSDVSIPDNTAFAYDAGFGFNVALAKHVQTAFGYRYVDAGNIGGGEIDGNTGSSAVTLPMPGNNNDFNEFYVRLVYQL